MRSSTLINAYQRAHRLRRLMLAIFVVMSLGTLMWVIPWFPGGLDTTDYKTDAAVPVALAFGAWVSAFGAVYLRDQSNRYEQTLVTWSSVHDELGDLRRREYFFERVIIECTRSDRSDIPFGVFAARFGTGEGIHSAETASALEALAGLVRQSDSLAALGPQEVGVLGAGMGAREAPAFAYRLKSTLENTMGARDDDQVSVGWAIWGVDGTDAGSLVGIARQRMHRKAATRDLARSVEGEEPERATEDEALVAEDEPATGLAEIVRFERRDGTAA